ncbi:hypothetical protein V5799_023667 [Amblyomma americanum]|uniref:Uncharacterized protein n=1 Tax=Amblyomma americanum TaxID=6943 RepID=A0AAQ4FGX2_AMBAM
MVWGCPAAGAGNFLDCCSRDISGEADYSDKYIATAITAAVFIKLVMLLHLQGVHLDPPLLNIWRNP